MTEFNTLRPRQDGGHFPDDVFKCIFLNENAWILIKISLRFVPKGPINNIPALIQIMAWRRPDDRPFSEPVMVKLRTHICVTQPQWVNSLSLASGSINLRILCWCYDMETLSALLTICESNPLVDSPHKRLVIQSLMFPYCQPEQAVDQTVRFPVLWDIMRLMWQC